MKAFNISELPSKKKCQSSWIASRSIAPIMIWYNASPDTEQIKGFDGQPVRGLLCGYPAASPAARDS